MAKYKQKGMEIAGWSGCVGGIVWRKSRGRWVLSRPGMPHNPQTPAQEEQRARWTVASRFLSALNPAITIGYEPYAPQGGSGRNNALQDVLRDAVISTGTSASIDLTRVMIAKGALENISDPSVSQVTGSHAAKLTWVDNSGEGAAAATDFVVVALYNPTINAAIIKTDAFNRDDETATINYPADWAGATLTVFAFTKGTLLSFNAKGAKSISNSLNCGSITAA